MTAKLVRFPGALMGFIQSFLEQVRNGATEAELRALWSEHRGALRTDTPYQDLLEFFIAIDDATRACPPGSVGAMALPNALEKPANRRLRVVSPLAEYARRRYGGFQAAYAYTLPLEATFGADDPALFIAKAGAELFPLKDPVSPKDMSPYASKDLSTLGVQGINHWFVGELLQWAKPRIGSELTEFLHALASGGVEKYVPPKVRVFENIFLPSGAAFGELNDRMYDMLAVYSLKRAISHNDIQLAFGRLTAGHDLRWADIRPGGALFYCLDQRNLDTLVRGAITLGLEYDSESNCRTEKEYVFVCINDVIAAMVNRGTKRRAPFSLRTTKMIFDRLVYLCGVDSLGEVIRIIPYDHYGRDIGYLMEPPLSAIIADSLSGGLLLEPIGDYSSAQNPESRFFSVGLSDSAVGKILRRARASDKRAQHALIHDAGDERFAPSGRDWADFSFSRMPVYRYAIERAINATSFELASSIVAFLIFGAAYRTNGTFRLTRPYSQKARELKQKDLEGIADTNRMFRDFEEDISDMLSLVPLGLGLRGGERVRKAVTVAAVWARKSGAPDVATRLMAFLPKAKDGQPLTNKSVAREISRGEGHNTEFKETVRFDVKKNEIEKKADRVISLAWLKAVAAFLNTDGGTLLCGVQDDGTVCGLDRDGFDSADKRDRFVRQRISDALGVSAHSYLMIAERLVCGKRIVRIQCQPAAPEQIYLRPSAESPGELYIRTGPGNKKLEGKDLAEHVTRINRLWGNSRSRPESRKTKTSD